MPGKPLTTIVEELNNVLTVVAMCTDELETLGPQDAPMTDLRAAVRRGAELTRLLSELRPKPLPPIPAADESEPRISDVHAAPATVLVIEDDHVARGQVLAKMAGRGWRVMDASNIDDAFESLEEVRAIDVLVIDTCEASRRFASKLVERYPSAAVVYTGDPFAPDALVSQVSETIARRR